MKVRFLKDYGGRDTGERRYYKGQVIELHSLNDSWIANGIIEIIDLPIPQPPAPEPEPVVITKRSRRKPK